MDQWRIGDVKITRIVELQVTGGSRFILPQATREEIQAIDWIAPHFADADGRLIMSIHALIVETPDRRIMVDTCLGNDKQRAIPGWNMRHGPFLEDIAAAGYPRDSIDTVLCTHLHVDHVGWNTMLVDGKWQPTFPNARYLIGAKEWEHWSSQNANQRRGDDILGDSVRPVFDAGLADLVEMDHAVGDGVWLEPTPGHTPGHVSVRISSRDSDAHAARTTRLAFLERYADGPVLVIGTHFATPTAGHIARDGDVYRLDV